MIQDRAGRWTIPKGHVEPGESIEQTALREGCEETGLNNLRLGRRQKLRDINDLFHIHRIILQKNVKPLPSHLISSHLASASHVDGLARHCKGIV